MKAKINQRSNKVKLYCDPQTRAFLAENWLNVSSFEARILLPKVLAQLGVSGNVTAFLQRKENIACFSLSATDEILKVKFFDHREPDYTSACIIPDYDTTYSRSFAITEMDGNRLYFYNLSDNELSPCFMKTTYESNVCCMEVTRSKTKIRVSFEAPKLFGCSLLVTLAIKNTRASMNAIEAATKRILNVINSENGKNVYMYYELLSKFLNHVVADYTLSYSNANGTVTDEIVVENNFCEKFTVTNSGTTITVFRNHDWQYKSEFLTAQRIGENFSFSSDCSEFEIDQIENIATLDHWIRKFISNNMWFAFEKISGSK